MLNLEIFSNITSFTVNFVFVVLLGGSLLKCAKSKATEASQSSSSAAVTPVDSPKDRKRRMGPAKDLNCKQVESSQRVSLRGAGSTTCGTDYDRVSTATKKIPSANSPQVAQGGTQVSEPVPEHQITEQPVQLVPVSSRRPTPRRNNRKASSEAEQTPKPNGASAEPCSTNQVNSKLESKQSVTSKKDTKRLSRLSAETTAASTPESGRSKNSKDSKEQMSGNSAHEQSPVNRDSPNEAQDTEAETQKSGKGSNRQKSGKVLLDSHRQKSGKILASLKAARKERDGKNESKKQADS